MTTFRPYVSTIIFQIENDIVYPVKNAIKLWSQTWINLNLTNVWAVLRTSFFIIKWWLPREFKKQQKG